MSTPATGVRPDGVGQVAVNVREIPRAVAFYRDTLGLPFLFEVPGAAFFDCGGLRLMLTVPERPEYDHPASLLYYRVADLHAAFAALVAAGVRVDGEPHRIAQMPDHDLWMAFLRDSEDNPFALMAEMPPAG
ncbi:MAG TPA: VOC family protein [Longimicrobiaceae bacterium]|nr:VOC family protein [Longimicrobiaceae bacterium]